MKESNSTAKSSLNKTDFKGTRKKSLIPLNRPLIQALSFKILKKQSRTL